VTQRLGGTITLNSAEGRGAAFILRIPQTAPGNVELWIDES